MRPHNRIGTADNDNGCEDGSQFDPDLADLICADTAGILGGLGTARTWEAVIGAEPALSMTLLGEQLDAALLGVANFVDLKSPYMLGHASAVAKLAGIARGTLGLDDGEVELLRRAALVSGLAGGHHPSGDKPGPLGPGERERVRLQPYLTERMLQQSGWLAPLGSAAVQLRERLDGSGYPRGLAGDSISVPGRILGAADAYQAMREPRPYRSALSGDDAAAGLRAEATAGRVSPWPMWSRRRSGPQSPNLAPARSSGESHIVRVFTSTKLIALFGLIILGIFVCGNHEVWHNNLKHFWDFGSYSADENGKITFTQLTVLGLMAAMGAGLVGSLFSSDAWNNVTFIAAKLKTPSAAFRLVYFLGR